MPHPRLSSLVLVLLAAALAAPPSEAIPAFARRYRLSCSTCHAPFPRLKPYGDEFAARGFRMAPGQEPARASLDVGDPLLLLPRDIPLAMRLEGFASWNQDAAAEADVEYPYVFKILSGGPIAKKVSYYVYFIVEKGEVEGLEDAYLQVNGIFGSPVDLIVGQFQVSDPLFKRELRLERLDYEVFNATVGDSRVKLTYDRGLMALWTAPGKVDVVLEVVNGNGIKDPAAEFDRDSYKNVALRLARAFGRVRVGLFGYTGKENGEVGGVNRTTYLGPDLVVDFSRKLQLNLEFLERRDDDPLFTGESPGDVVTRGGFAELVWLPLGEDGRLALSALYNRIDSDLDPSDGESAALAVSWLLARNVRFSGELGRDFEAEASRVSLGLIAAF